MPESIYEQTKAVIAELCEKAKLTAGNIVVVGCSTSEVVGSKIGTNSSPEVAGEIFNALNDYTKSKGIFLAIQCCEHLNRAIITERKAVPLGEIVNVVPQPKAGGSLATKAYAIALVLETVPYFSRQSTAPYTTASMVSTKSSNSM